MHAFSALKPTSFQPSIFGWPPSPNPWYRYPGWARHNLPLPWWM